MTIRTSNFDALLASVPNDRLAAVVVSRSRGAEAPDFDEAYYQELVTTKKVLQERLTVMNTDGVSRSEPRRVSVAKHITEIEAELRELKPLRKFRKPEPETFTRAFVNEAKRLLPKQQFSEVMLAAQGACTIATDPRDMWERAAPKRATR